MVRRAQINRKPKFDFTVELDPIDYRQAKIQAESRPLNLGQTESAVHVAERLIQNSRIPGRKRFRMKRASVGGNIVIDSIYAKPINLCDLSMWKPVKSYLCVSMAFSTMNHTSFGAIGY